MNGKSNKLIGMVIGGTLLALGVAGALFYLKTKPQASRRTMSAMIPVVETMALPVGELALTIDCPDLSKNGVFPRFVSQVECSKFVSGYDGHKNDTTFRPF